MIYMYVNTCINTCIAYMTTYTCEIHVCDAHVLIHVLTYMYIMTTHVYVVMYAMHVLIHVLTYMYIMTTHVYVVMYAIHVLRHV